MTTVLRNDPQPSVLSMPSILVAPIALTKFFILAVVQSYETAGLDAGLDTVDYNVH